MLFPFFAAFSMAVEGNTHLYQNGKYYRCFSLLTIQKYPNQLAKLSAIFVIHED